MSIRKFVLTFIILISGSIAYSQKFSLRPELGFAMQGSKLLRSTIPEPYFSTFYNRGAIWGIYLEYNYKKTDKLYFKVQNAFIANGFANTTNEKPLLLYGILGSNAFTSSDYYLALGIGIKKDLLLNAKQKAVYLIAGIDVGYYGNPDFLGGISGGGSPNFYTKFESFKLHSTRKFFPVAQIGFAHPFLNNKKREILQMSIIYHRAFTTIWEHELKFEYSGPRYGSNTTQSAFFGSSLNTILFTLSKEIRIKNKKSK